MKTKWEALHITPINLTDTERKQNHKQIARHLHSAHAFSSHRPVNSQTMNYFLQISDNTRTDQGEEAKMCYCWAVRWFKRFLKLKEYNQASNQSETAKVTHFTLQIFKNHFLPHKKNKINHFLVNRAYGIEKSWYRERKSTLRHTKL